MDALFGKGFVLGLSLAAPLGPMGVLCIRRTLASGFRFGLVTGLGVASADMIYGAIAAFGLTAVSDALVRFDAPMRAVGGAFLGYLGVKTFLSAPSARPAEVSGAGIPGAYFSALALTLSSPATILLFFALFSGMGLASGVKDYAAASVLVAGVFAGSIAWWVFLSGATSRLRRQLNPRVMAWVNRVSGLVILGFALFAFRKFLD